MPCQLQTDRACARLQSNVPALSAARRLPAPIGRNGWVGMNSNPHELFRGCERRIGGAVRRHSPRVLPGRRRSESSSGSAGTAAAAGRPRRDNTWWERRGWESPPPAATRSLPPNDHQPRHVSSRSSTSQGQTTTSRLSVSALPRRKRTLDAKQSIDLFYDASRDQSSTLLERGQRPP